MTEAQEQEAVIAYCDWQHIPIFHIPNGGSRHPAEALNMKRQGVRAGVPDLFIPLARGGKHGLFIEMKRAVPKRGKVSEPQRRWLEYLNSNDYVAVIAYGANQAIDAIKNYKGMERNKVTKGKTRKNKR